jgi:hypothetical protein
MIKIPERGDDNLRNPCHLYTDEPETYSAIAFGASNIEAVNAPETKQNPGPHLHSASRTLLHSQRGALPDRPIGLVPSLCADGPIRRPGGVVGESR